MPAGFETDLINAALDHLGETPIASIDDPSTKAQRAKRSWRQSLSFVLRDHRWNVAERRRRIAALSTPPDFGWGAQYELPADCLRVLDIDGDETIAHRIEGRRLLTDEPGPLNLRYVSDLTDLGVIPDPLLFEACALHLAWKLCPGTQAKDAKRDQLWRELQAVLRTARGVDAQEGTPQDPGDYTLERARL